MRSAVTVFYATVEITQVRKLVRGIWPVEVDADGLRTALKELVNHIGTQHQTRCEFRCDRPAPIQDNMVAIHLFRIAQEAVNNAIKHGPAKRVVVTLESDEGETSLRIRDDGPGFDIHRRGHKSKGMGLRIMRNRASLIGARFDIGLVNGHGTEVSCVLRTG